MNITRNSIDEKDLEEETKVGILPNKNKFRIKKVRILNIIFIKIRTLNGAFQVKRKTNIGESQTLHTHSFLINNKKPRRKETNSEDEDSEEEFSDSRNMKLDKR